MNSLHYYIQLKSLARTTLAQNLPTLLCHTLYWLPYQHHGILVYLPVYGVRISTLVLSDTKPKLECTSSAMSPTNVVCAMTVLF